MNFCYLITAFILSIFFIIFTKAQGQKARIKNFSIRDYSVLISDSKPILKEYLEHHAPLPACQLIPAALKPGEKMEIPRKIEQAGIENGEHFKNFFHDYIKDRNEFSDLKIKIINLCYNLRNYNKFKSKYEECKKSIFQIENNPYNISLNEEENLKGDQQLYYNFFLYKIGIYVFHCCCCRKKGPTLGTLKNKKIEFKNFPK